MALFGSRRQATPETSEATAQAPATQNAQIAPEVISQIVASVIQQMQASAQPQALAPQAEPEAELDESQRNERRFNRIETVLNDLPQYANAFNASVPTVVRESVVNNLTPGKRKLYDKYKAEVDKLMSTTTIEAKSHPETHQRAINMILGEHLDEVETLVLNSAEASDVPHLAIPSVSIPEPAEPQLSEMDRSFVGAYSAAQPRLNWDASSYNYYKKLPRGFLHDMVAEHRRRKAS